MKRIVAALLLVAILVTALASCGKKKEKFDLVSTADPAFDYYHADLSAYLSSLSREEYVGITVSLDVTDKEVDDYLNDYLLPSYRTPTMTTDVAVKEGDTVYIYYTGYIDGEPFEGGSNADDDRPYGLVIGSGSFISGFEDQLIGVIPKNTSQENPKQVNVTFPDNYRNADLAGKPARFDVVVAGIWDGGYEVPELTEEFARTKINNFTPETDDPVGEFREALRDYLREQKAANLEQRKFTRVMEQLFSTLNLTGSFPKGEIKRIEAAMEEVVTNYYQQYNFYYYMQYGQVYYDGLDSAARGYYGLRFDADWKTYQTSAAAKTVKQFVILNAIARLEGIDVTEEEAKDWVREQVKAEKESSQNPDDVTVESVLEKFSLEEIYAQVAAQKARDFLLENVTFDYTGLPID